jgi:choline dehydrogenase-like flavoprotein
VKSIASEVVPLDAEGQVWDAIVIGTGAGGATAGSNLARLERSVLFVERGKLLHHHAMVARGDAFWWTGDPEKALNYGWWLVLYTSNKRWRFASDRAANRLRCGRIDRAVQSGDGALSPGGFHPASFLTRRP